jgi:hypothetical protein
VKAGGKQNNQLAKISDYVGNRKEMEDRKSIPVGSPAGQNEMPVRIGCQKQQSEPIGDENRILVHSVTSEGQWVLPIQSV